MHHQSDRRLRKRRPRRRGARAAAAGNRPKPGGIRRPPHWSNVGEDPVDLLAHLCEIMDLFPSEGDQALAELVGRMHAHKAGAASPRRRLGRPKGKPLRQRSRK